MPHVLIPLDMAEPCLPAANAVNYKLSGASMGTSWAVQLYCPPMPDLHAIQLGIQARLDRVVMQMSTWDAGSRLCQFNRTPALDWQTLEPEFFKVLDYSLYLAQQTSGAFDITAGKLVNLWGFGPSGKRDAAPTDSDVTAAMQSGNWKSLELDRLQQRLRQNGRIALDVSAIAKGFAVDQVADYLEELGVSSYLVEIGGELRGLGMKPDRSPWWVEIEHPSKTSQARDAAYLVALHGLAIATSGDYRQYVELDGRRYAHTIDPRSGYPVDNDLASVTVLHSECMVADALATALMVLGCEAGLHYANQHQIAALLLRRTASGLEEISSRRLQAMRD